MSDEIKPTLTKLEYFTLIIAANLDGYPDTWADRAIDKAQRLIAALYDFQGDTNE